MIIREDIEVMITADMTQIDLAVATAPEIGVVAETVEIVNGFEDSAPADDTVSSTNSSGANAHSSRYYNDYNSCDDTAYDKNGSYDRDRDRDRDRTYYHKEKREEVPNSTLMIRGLAPQYHRTRRKTNFSMRFDLNSISFH